MKTALTYRWTTVAAFVGLAFVWAMGGTVETRSSGHRNKPLEWGAYQIYWSHEYGKMLAREFRQFASKPYYVMFYRDLGRSFPSRAIEGIQAYGATPIVSLELWSWHAGRKGSYLPTITAGKLDNAFRAWAQSAKEYGDRVLLRFGFEFNGDWFSWSGDAPAYVSAWRHVHAIFREVGADNVEWVWAPNVVSCPDVPSNEMHGYYPGDDFVDWIGVDGYNFGEHHDKWHHWQSFDDIFGKVLHDFEKKYPKKPVIITEFGCAPGEGDQRATWIRLAHRSLAQHRQVRAAIWFHYDKRRENEPNWRIDVTPDSLRAFNETFAMPVPTKP